MKWISVLVTVLVAGGVYGAGPMHGGRPGRPAGGVRPINVQPIHVGPSACRAQYQVPSMFFFVTGKGCSDQVTYSPYALEHGSSGLVPSYLEYNPYALEYGKSGLVPSGVEYNPYAFDHEHSGLVGEAASGYRPRGTCDGGTVAVTGNSRSCVVAAWPQGTPAHALQPCSAFEPLRMPGVGDVEPDQKAVIQAYLDRTYPGRCRITRILRVDNEAVCFDIVVEGKNVVIKYWNGAKINAIKQHGGCVKKIYNQYLLDWIEYRDQFEANGGKVYHFASDDTYDLLSTLGTCVQTDNG